MATSLSSDESLPNGEEGIELTNDGAGQLRRSVQAAWNGTPGSHTTQPGRPLPLTAGIVRRLTAGTIDEEAGATTVRTEEDTARDGFLKSVFSHWSDAKSKQKHSAEYQWYITFLDAKFGQVWTALLKPVLVGIDSEAPPGHPREIAIIYQFLTVVATKLKGGTGLAMIEIVDALQFATPSLIKEEEDGNRDLANQLTFRAVSWLTLLFEVAPDLDPTKLEIRNHPPPSLHESPHSRVITQYGQDFDTFDQPLCFCFKKFGSLIPELKPEALREAEVITASYVYFAVLDKVANVQIQWVNSLCLHLEFDHVKRILKLFRFPSFCKLMYQDVNPLSQLYIDHAHYFVSDRTLERPETDHTQAYFREVLLTYRLLFGQDKASYKLFARKAAKGKWPTTHCDCADCTGTENRDLLLHTLCGTAWSAPAASALYFDIGAQDDSPYYYSDSDFRFFGRRILDLQAFVSGRNPHSVRALWYDRRNIAFWWTFWAVLFVGGGTLLIGILQLAFQIWQAQTGQKQVSQNQVQ